MAQHIAIRREEYVSGTRERPEVHVFTQTHATRHPVPWGKIAIGEDVWMKWAGGPIVGHARVKGVRQFERCTPEILRAAVSEFSLARMDEYWKHLPPAFSAVAIYLDDEVWLDIPISPKARSRGESWIVLSSAEALADWLGTLGNRDAPEGTKSAERGASAGKSRTLSKSLRFQVLHRDGFKCWYCGSKAPDVKLHVDHIVPWSVSRSNTLENLRTACEECNLGKGASRV